jgi:hypothetical protein
MKSVALLVLCSFLPAAASAQGSADAPLPLPPLVEAEGTPPPPPPPEPAPPPSSSYVPGQKSAVPYPYSPAVPTEPARPPPEVGLMITESLFGMLTAAGTGLLGWYLLVKPLTQSGIDPAIGNLIFGLTFASVPMAVAQTQLNLANGSRYYYSESWPAYLSGLGAQAAVLGLFYLVGGVNSPWGERLLLVGTVVGVPLTTMAVINLTKQPRRGPRVGSLLGWDPASGLVVSVPRFSPTALRTARGASPGLFLGLAEGRF